MTAPDIFLSYNREDQARAKLFADAFAAEGLNVWWDTALRSGEAYDEVTEAALRAAKAVVVLWSPRSVVSRWVRAEATIADRCKTLVPVTIEACERPIMFELTQTAELSHWRGNAGDRAWQAFLSDLRRMVNPGQMLSVTPSLPQAPAAPIANGRPSLAIRPFKGLITSQLSDGVDQGLVDEISTALIHFKYLLNVREQIVGARYLLEGTFRQSGTQVRLSTRLLDADAGTPIWADQYDMALPANFAAQEELAGNLVARMAAVIEATETRRASSVPAVEADNYQLLLAALHSIRNFSAQSLGKACELMERALQSDPDDPHVLALASLTHGMLLAFRCAPDPGESKRLAQTYMRRALQISGEDPQVLGWAAVGGTASGADITTLDAMIDLALDRNPRWAYLWSFSGNTKLSRGNLDEALSHYEASLRLDPRSPDRWAVLSGLGLTLALLKRYQEAVPYLIESEQLLVGNERALTGLIFAYVHLDRLDDAWAARLKLPIEDDEITFDVYRDPGHRAQLSAAMQQALNWGASRK